MIHAAILLFLAPLLSDDAWNRLDKEARALSGEMGEPARKSALAAELATEDSERVARLLLEIAEDARQRHEKAEKRRERAEEDFRRLTRALRKQKGRRTSLSDDSRWTSKRDELEEAKSAVETEETFLRILRRTIGGLRSPEACAALVDPKSARYRKSPFVRRGILDALWDQKGFEADIRAFARDMNRPEQRARVLDWIARKRVTAGFDVAMECMRAKEPAVVRSAVAALQSLDDPRCVPALVTCRRKAEGQLAEELEFALHHFTGKKFFGAGAGDAYGAWWRAEGEAWLAEKTRKRYGDPERKGSAHFYGIPTRSERIVFVLDRSLSMKEPVPQAAVTTGTPWRVSRLATKPMRRMFVSRSSFEKPSPFERFVRTTSPSSTSMRCPRSRSTGSIASASVVFPAPDSPVNQRTNPLLCMLFLPRDC